jgi:hypothetical protein
MQVVKSASTVSLVMEMFVRLLHECGLPKTDLDLLHSNGPRAQELIEKSNIRLTQFTGSAGVAEKVPSPSPWCLLFVDALCFQSCLRSHTSSSALLISINFVVLAVHS